MSKDKEGISLDDISPDINLHLLFADLIAPPNETEQPALPKTFREALDFVSQTPAEDSPLADRYFKNLIQHEVKQFYDNISDFEFNRTYH